MSVLFILLPTAFAVAGSTAVTGAAVVGGAATASGLAALGATVAGTVVAMHIKHRPSQGTVAYETHFTRADILVEALALGSYDVEQREAEIVVGIGNQVVIFQREEETGRFHAILSESFPLDDLKQFFDSLYADYGRTVQTRAYERLMERAKAAGMELEQQQVEGDNSIALTFKVRA